MWDWRYPLTDIRDEIRKGRSNGENSTSFDSLEHLLDQLSDIYQTLEYENSQKEDNPSPKNELSDFIQKQKEVITNSYEHAKQYANIITLGGYAGLFSIWNLTKENLASWQSASVAILALLSLLIYIVFELYGAWLRTTQVNNQMSELIEAEELGKFPEKYGEKELARVARLMKIWPFFFFATTSLAFSAAALLIYAFIIKLI